MVIVIAYGAGGYNPVSPNGNAVDWADTSTRLRWTVGPDGAPVSRPFNDAENAVADALERDGHAAETQAAVRQAVAGGVASLQAAIAAAQADRAAAATLKAQADSLAGTPLLTVAALSSAVQGLAQAVSQLAGWRSAVDDAIITIDNDLIYLARLAAGTLTS